MIKRNPTKPVRVVPPMMEEQEVSTITLQEWLDREETVSHLLFCKGKEEGIDKSYKSFKNCTFQHQTFSECKFRSSQLTDVRFENCDLSNLSLIHIYLWNGDSERNDVQSISIAFSNGETIPSTIQQVQPCLFYTSRCV